MITFRELVLQPFPPCQRSFLTPSKLIDKCRERAPNNELVWLSWEHLEALHAAEILIPALQVNKDAGKIRRLFRESSNNGRIQASALLRMDVPNPLSLIREGNFANAIDPEQEEEPPKWYRFVKEFQGKELWTTTFLYSPYQLLMVPKILSILPKMTQRKSRRKYSTHGAKLTYHLKIDKRNLEVYRKAGAENRRISLVLSALENWYFPKLRGHWYSSQFRGNDIDAIFAYESAIAAPTRLQKIGFSHAEISENATRLLRRAESLDPLRQIGNLIRAIHPDKWFDLRGNALCAIEHRIAAEMLLRFYEDLVKSNTAPPLPKIPPFAWHPLVTRLKFDPADLDEILMEYGLSPFPSLLLILEGKTEMQIVPRALELFGIGASNRLIEIFNAKTITADYGLLARYVAAPRLGKSGEEHVDLIRPLTKIVVVVDAEDRFKDQNDTIKKRGIWASRIFSTLPEEYQTRAMKDAVTQLVDVKTWQGQVFEFAHFSDAELANGILTAYSADGADLKRLCLKLKVGNQTALQQKLTNIISGVRGSGNGNLDHVYKDWPHRPSKPAIADTLWPALERRLLTAQSEEQLRSIPIASILMDIRETIAMNRRRNLVMKL